MNCLPEEILELILANLPLADLLQSYSLVSKQWYQTISRKNFIPWKKVYFAYLSQKDEKSKAFLRDTCNKQKITCAENCLHGLLHFIMYTTRMHNQKTLELIKSKHQLANHSEKLIRELFHLTVEDNLSLSVTWGVTGMICMISHNVWDIFKLINILTDSNSDCTTMEALEKLYCFSTFLLYFTREFQIPSRLHYNLIYALNLFESCWNVPMVVSNSPASQPVYQQTAQTQTGRKVQHALTHEQLRIVNHQIKKDHLIKIVAFAGSGKTSTLLRFTEKNPELKFLLIVYNRSVADDASRKFPSTNVQCKTVHQLAYRHMASLFKNKELKNIYPTELADTKILRDRSGTRRYQREKLVLDTLDRYWSSADENITVDHTPKKIVSSSRDHNGLVTEKVLTIENRRELVKDAKVVWAAIKNPNHKELRQLPHDAYLKLWQLTKPNLFQSEDVHCVMVDEGQDMNGAMLDIFLTHPGPRVIVGDPNQQIYRWRNAINALDKVPSTHTFYLTQSFRFGPEIGFLANSCLNFLNKVNDRYLVGGYVRDSLGSTIKKPASIVDVGSQKQMCFLARTNLALFKKAVQVLGCDVSGNSQRQLPRIAFAGGLKKMQFGSLIDILNLKRGAYYHIKNPFLRNQKRFPNYNSFVNYVEAVDDREWGVKIALVNWAGDKIEYYVETIEKAHVEMHEADVVFSTAHRAKGMEWDEVFILDDFVPSLRSCEVNEEEQEERNLLYVAVTRAKQNLVINPAAYYTLLAVGERFERVVETEAHVDGQITSCTRCQEILPGKCKARISSLCTVPLSLMTVNSEMNMASQEGVLCTLCAGLPWYTYLRFSCYEHELPPVRVKDDKGHLTFRFLVGPTAHEKEMADAHYAEERLLMLDGFIQARQLALPRPPIVVNDPEPIFPVDDVLVLQAMMERAEGPREEDGGNYEEFEAVAVIHNEQGDRFPDDDDIFPIDELVDEKPTKSLNENLNPSQQPIFPSDDSDFDDLEF